MDTDKWFSSRSLPTRYRPLALPLVSRSSQSPPSISLQNSFLHHTHLWKHSASPKQISSSSHASDITMAAALQNATVSLQSKIPPSARLLSNFTSSKPLNLSFSATFPSLHFTTTTTTNTHRRRGGSALGTKMASTAAGSYAAALADVAKSNNTLEATSSDMEKLDNFFSDKQVFDFFANPVIDLIKKRQVLDELAQSSSLQPHTVNFVNILIDAKRVDLFKEIVKEFETAYNKLTHTELAVVSSVVKLEPDSLTQIAKQVQKLTGAKNVRIKTVIDPSLVAGFTVRYGNSGSKLIDFSVKKQLEEIAAQLDLSDIDLVA